MSQPKPRPTNNARIHFLAFPTQVFDLAHPLLIESASPMENQRGPAPSEATKRGLPVLEAAEARCRIRGHVCADLFRRWIDLRGSISAHQHERPGWPGP